ncbi:MAG: toll/interleukin-1 receptor domain-containing protein [Anaerolineae bacterium]
MSHVFVSYSKKNKDYVLRLVEKLLDEGFDVWIDNRRLRSSDDWWRSIVEALRDCGAVVVVLTPESDASEWVQLEITLAMKYKKQRFPILLSGSMDTPNWAIFARTQYIDATNGQLPPPDFFDELASHARRKSFRGSAVAATGRLDKKIGQVMEDDPVLKEALDKPPQSDDGEDDDDLDTLLRRIAPATSRRPSRMLMAGGAGVVLLLAVLFIVPRIASPPVTPTLTATSQSVDASATPQQSDVTPSPTADLRQLPGTLENLNAWRGSQGYPALESNELLNELAERHMSYLISLPLSDLNALPTLNQDRDGRNAQDMAEAAGYAGTVQMVVKVTASTPLLDEVLTLIETGSEATGAEVHQQFKDVGLASQPSATTDSLYYVLILGSGNSS